MSVIAEFRVPAENFALAATLAALDVNFEAERVTAYDTDRVLPLRSGFLLIDRFVI